MIPFGIFAPDQGRFSSGASSNILNAIPTTTNSNTGWGPMPSLTEIATALAAEPKGAIAARTSAGAYVIYAFTTTKIYKLDTTDYTWDDVSRASAVAYAVPDGDYWSIVQYGKYIVAVNLADDPQFIDVDAGTTFEAISGSPPKARFCWIAGEHLVLGAHASFPNRIQTSGRGDIAYWTVGQKGCDLQDLPDGEEVMGGVGSQRGAIVFQRKAIRQMILGAVGDYAFRLEVLNPSRGVIAPYSIVPLGPNSAAYLGSDGFSIDLGQQIGEGLVDRYVLDDIGNLESVKGALDPYQHIIWWQVTLTGGRKLLGYHYGLKRWCMSDEAVYGLVDMTTPAVTIDGLALLYASMDEIEGSMNSRLHSGGLPAFAAFNSSYELGFFTGSAQAATFDTWEMALAQGRRSFLSEVRAVTDATTHTMQVAGSDRFTGTAPTFGSAVSPNSSTGICHFRKDAYLHKLRLNIAAGAEWNHVLGVTDIRAVPTGRR